MRSKTRPGSIVPATHKRPPSQQGPEARFNHPVVGELELSYNRIEFAADPGLTIVAHTAEPGTRSQEALSLLASWAATEEAYETVSGVG